MEMRIRLPELLDEHGITAYELSKRSGNPPRISLSTIYRLRKSRGKVANFDADLLEAICDVLGIDDVGEVLEREGAKRPRRG